MPGIQIAVFRNFWECEKQATIKGPRLLVNQLVRTRKHLKRFCVRIGKAANVPIKEPVPLPTEVLLQVRLNLQLMANARISILKDTVYMETIANLPIQNVSRTQIKLQNI